MTDRLSPKSREQIAGDIIRKLRVETEFTDISPGSSLATLVEGIASAEYQIQMSVLKILEASNIDSLTGVNLENKGKSLGIPNTRGGTGKIPSSQASGRISIGSSFTKVSSKPYAGKPAPFAGSTTIYLEDGSKFSATGKIYLGRGTVDRFEGPINYSSVVDQGSFWVMQLAQPLTKNHPYTDLVVFARGGDRTISAGTIVQVPSNSAGPAVSYTTDFSVTIADGESDASSSVTCTQFGEVGNALAGAIKQFANAPFAGATVTNTSSFINGSSTESDEAFRKRIKNYPSTLSRGTREAIRAAIQGAKDPVTGRTIVSSSLVEPVSAGARAKLYIDDSTGLEPTFSGQSYELLRKSTSGQEKSFQTAQFPITAVVAVGTSSGPFQLEDGQSMTVVLDGVSETLSITGSNYRNLNAATAFELVRDFNSQSNMLGFRTTDGGSEIAGFDLSGTAEVLQVLPGDLQKILGLPTSLLRPLFLYKNGEILSFRGKTATLSTAPYPWTYLTEADLLDVSVIVDGVTQTITVTDDDFVEFDDIGVSTATLPQWASVLSKKIAGATFTPVGNVLVWTTNKDFSPDGSLEIRTTRLDGSESPWIGSDKMWAVGQTLSDVGATKDYDLNRFNGQIELLAKPAPGSKIEIGSRSTRAFVASKTASNGLFALDPLPDTIGNSRIIVAFDGDFAIRDTNIANGLQVTPSFPDAANAYNIVRLTANDTGLFYAAEIGDYIYLSQYEVANISRVKWGSAAEGLYQIKAKGQSRAAANTLLSALPATVVAFESVSLATYPQSNQVTVTVSSGHGLTSGALINVLALTAIGGISTGNLSATNAFVRVIDSTTFIYTALAAATSQASGFANVNTNKIVVSLDSHDLASGGVLAVTASALGGVSSGNMGVTAPLTVVNDSTFYFYAGGASTLFGGAPGQYSGSVTATYQADCWVEFEVSEAQRQDWDNFTGQSVVIEAEMVTIFKSTTTPQVVDFDGTMKATADEVVALVSAQISGGSIAKIDPQNVVLRSNDYKSGTCAVLVSLGSAVNLFVPTLASSLQAHTGAAPSGYVGSGFAVVSNVVNPSGNHHTRSYLVVDKDMTDITSTGALPTVQQPAANPAGYPAGFEHLWVTGRQSGLLARVYNTTPTAPYGGFMRGDGVIAPLAGATSKQNAANTFDNYSNVGLRLTDLALTESDKLVVEMDLDAIDKTVAIPMYKRAQIQDIDSITGVGAGSSVSFRLKDPEDLDSLNLPRPFFDAQSAFKAFDFSDFRLVTKSIGVYKDTIDQNVFAIGELTAVAIGENTSIKDGDKFTLDDGANDPVVFEFNSSLASALTSPTNIPVSYTGGVRALGSITIPAAGADLATGIVDGDYFTLNDGSNGAQKFEFDTNGSVTAGNVAVTLTPATKASGLLTIPAIGAHATSGIKDGDTVTLNDGAVTKVFEFDSNLSVTSGNVAVTILATDTAANVKAALMTAINAAGMNITAASGTNFDINLSHLLFGTVGNQNIASSNANAGGAIAHTGMSGGTAWPTQAQVKAAVILAIQTTVITIAVTSGAGGLLNLQNTVYGTAGNQPITQSLSNSQTLSPVGLSGGVNEASAATVKTAIIAAINGLNQMANPLTISAATGSGNTILLANSQTGVAGNQAITEIISNGATLSPVGMAGGYSQSSATAKALVLRSTSFAGAAQLAVSLRYPTTADAALSVSHTNDFYGGRNRTQLAVVLASGSLVAGSTYSSGTYTVTASPVGSLRVLRFAAAGLNTASQYIPGNLINVSSGVLAGSYKILTASAGLVYALAPASAGIGITSASFDASMAPLTSFPLGQKTLVDIADAINAYSPTNPVATAEAIGTGLASYYVTNATYITSPNASPSPSTDIASALIWHSFYCKNSGSASIYQYDSSNSTLNNIKALVQSADSLFPTSAESAGTSYSPINEEVFLLPSNTYTLSRWVNFNAVSSLPVNATIEPVQSAALMQIASRKDGAGGAVRVTGVTANALESFAVGNAETKENAAVLGILWADVKSISPRQLVRIDNSQTSELYRPYRSTPTGFAITKANPASIAPFFRTETSVKYIWLDKETVRLLFYRNGMGTSQVEPLTGGTVTLTNLGSGLVKVQASTGTLSARTGDMMYVRPDSSPFASDVQCKALPANGQAVPTTAVGQLPEYWGYPVVDVIDSKTVVIIAPNITSFVVTAITRSTDLVFVAPIWNEKNIRSNRAEGAKFEATVNGGKMSAIVKKLGGSMVSIFVRNSATEATDSLKLAEMGVSTDDYVILGEGFASENQGTFKLVAHNGRNHLIVYNPNGGKDEIADFSSYANSGVGTRAWGNTPTYAPRPIRILDGESVRPGDRLRISSPLDTAQWFPSSLIGTWEVENMGYYGYNFATPGLDASKFCPFVDLKIIDAPKNVTNANNAVVDSFTLGANVASLGFVEKSPYYGFRWFTGAGVNPLLPEMGEAFLQPATSTHKMSQIFGTKLSAAYKIDFSSDVFEGIDGYKTFTGLIGQAHKIIDGSPTNSVLFPGVRAAGTKIEVLPPLIKTISFLLQVSPKDGVSLDSISPVIKAAVASYVNSLGVGRPVVLSEIIKVVQALPGVFSVSIVSTSPAVSSLTPDRIVAGDIEKCIVLNANADVVVG